MQQNTKGMTGEEFMHFAERLRFWNCGAGVNEHITSDPIFIVQKKVRDFGFDPDFGGEAVFVHDGEDYGSLQEFCDELDDGEQGKILGILEIKDISDVQYVDDDDVMDALEEIGFDGIYRTGYQTRWEYVSAHFTKEAAEAYIKRKSHDYPLGMRVYVEAQVYCWEFQKLIAGIIDGSIGIVRQDAQYRITPNQNENTNL